MSPAWLLALGLPLAASPTPVPAPSPAAPKLTATAVIERVNRANSALKSWSGDFLERRVFVHFNESESRAGRIAYLRGKGLRLDLTEPDPETILITKERALQWRPKTRQLHIFHLEGKDKSGVSPIPFAFGDGGFDPARDHQVRLVESSDPEVGLELIPKEEGSTYVRRTLWLDPRTWLPLKLQLVESTDDVVTIVFSATRLDPPLDDALFQLTPPQGAEVIEHSELPSF